MFQELGNDNFLGKVEGNFAGTYYNYYAYQPDITESYQLSATIHYPSTFSCEAAYRQIYVYLKDPDVAYHELVGT